MAQGKIVELLNSRGVEVGQLIGRRWECINWLSARGLKQLLERLEFLKKAI